MKQMDARKVWVPVCAVGISLNLLLLYHYARPLYNPKEYNVSLATTSRARDLLTESLFTQTTPDTTTVDSSTSSNVDLVIDNTNLESLGGGIDDSSSALNEAFQSNYTVDLRDISGVPDYKPPCSHEECVHNIRTCRCSPTDRPEGMPVHLTPQMIMLTFDDFVDIERFEFFKELGLISQKRRNPNGCPMSATLFVSDTPEKMTNFTLVRAMHYMGHEIAIHSLTHASPASKWEKGSKKFWAHQMVTMRDNLELLAGIPRGDLRGLRAPFLAMGGKAQMNMMMENGFEWDSTAITGPFQNGGAWPFAMGHTFESCVNRKCPDFGLYKGLWEVPLNRLLALKSKKSQGRECSMVDLCQTQPRKKKDAKLFLWKNFLHSYRGNRAPFGIFLHASWFYESKSKHGPMYLLALREFLDEISRLPDVYLLSVSQVVDWLKAPVPLPEVANFTSWRRTCARLPLEHQM